MHAQWLLSLFDGWDDITNNNNVDDWILSVSEVSNIVEKYTLTSDSLSRLKKNNLKGLEGGGVFKLHNIYHLYFVNGGGVFHIYYMLS